MTFKNIYIPTHSLIAKLNKALLLLTLTFLRENFVGTLYRASLAR
jgi:hypothetical protein